MGIAYVFALVLLLLSTMVGAAENDIYLSAIRFEGNEHTREEIMLQEMRVAPGQWVSQADINASRQAIMDLGLFQSVTAHLEQGEDGHILVITVKEKIYFLPIPILDGDPQSLDVDYGLELRADNLMGLNQRLRLIAQHKDSSSAVTPQQDTYRVTYQYPRVLGTPYAISLDTRLIQEDYNAADDQGHITGYYHRKVVSVDFRTSRWLVAEGPSFGWFGGTGIVYTSRAYDYRSGEPDVFHDGKAVRLAASLGYTKVHDHGYYMSGLAYGWNGNIDVPGLSDFSATDHLFYLRLYHHIPEQDANVNWQLRMGLAKGEVFDGKAFSIGGFTTLRGYEHATYGNAMFLSNLEYHQSLERWPTVRGVVFLDLGNVYDELKDINPGKLEAGVGVGLRWHVQFLVDVTVSLDFGYGLGPGTTVGYLGTSGTF